MTAHVVPTMRTAQGQKGEIMDAALTVSVKISSVHFAIAVRTAEY
jgi:hypothetical protein